jgi:hypothetical protein
MALKVRILLFLKKKKQKDFCFLGVWREAGLAMTFVQSAGLGCFRTGAIDHRPDYVWKAPMAVKTETRPCT